MKRFVKSFGISRIFRTYLLFLAVSISLFIFSCVDSLSHLFAVILVFFQSYSNSKNRLIHPSLVARSHSQNPQIIGFGRLGHNLFGVLLVAVIWSIHLGCSIGPNRILNSLLESFNFINFFLFFFAALNS